MVDLLFVSFNRIEMTREAFQAVIDGTDWINVNRLYVHDDGSTDGTREWLEEQVDDLPVNVVFNDKPHGGPVAATNWYLTASWDHYKQAIVDRFVKLDNDFVVCPGWLDELLRMATRYSDIDIFGMEPMKGNPQMPPFEGRTMEQAKHIGGKGLMRHRAFECCQPAAHGRQGFTQWQTSHINLKKAWITPDMPCFGLDQLGFEPWKSMADGHAKAGIARRWSDYPTDGTFKPYYGWWTPSHL